MFCSFCSLLLLDNLVELDELDFLGFLELLLGIRGAPTSLREPTSNTHCLPRASSAILLLSISLEQAQIRLFVKVFCGERGIRTPETLLEFTRFPGVPLQPLEHLSFVGMCFSHE